MLGTTDHEGIPIKKPWTVATTLHEIGLELSQYQCDESHDHVQGRGKPLKETEGYSFQFTDCVHIELSIGQLTLLESSLLLRSFRVIYTWPVIDDVFYLPSRC